MFWPLDNAYYPGVVKTVSDGMHHVAYDDGDTETLNISSETWRFTDRDSHAKNAVASLVELSSAEQNDLKDLLEHFGNKSFLGYMAEGFPSYLMQNAYFDEENSFKKTVRVVSRYEVPAESNVISSHVIYKIKVTDDGSLKLKARIAPHGNEDSLRYEMRTDCAMCAPMGVRLLISIAAVKKWRITKVDVKSAFLQTGAAERQVFVIPPGESKDRFKSLWLLLTASYGLVNANAKFQALADDLLLDLGLSRVIDVPQLFYGKKDGVLTVLMAKIVDDILITGISDDVTSLLREFNKRLKFGTITHGPGRLRYFGFNIVQYEDYTVVIDGDDKLGALSAQPLSRLRRKQLDHVLNDVEKSGFSSLNSSLGWLGLTVSPFCAAYASRLQQLLPGVRVSDLTKQVNCLRQLKKLGSVIKYTRPFDEKDYQISVLVFCDAGRSTENARLSVISGLLIGSMESGSVYHAVSWFSHKCKRPVRSIPAGEILAAGEGIDDGVVLKRAYALLLDVDVDLIVALDSKDLYSSLSTQRKSIDRSVRSDVNFIRYQFETRQANRIC